MGCLSKSITTQPPHTTHVSGDWSNSLIGSQITTKNLSHVYLYKAITVQVVVIVVSGLYGMWCYRMSFMNQTFRENIFNCKTQTLAPRHMKHMACMHNLILELVMPGYYQATSQPVGVSNKKKKKALKHP